MSSKLLSKEETIELRNEYIGIQPEYKEYYQRVTYVFSVDLKILKYFWPYKKACELFYHENPLKIVNAKGQYMYDELGNRYLDCINNVAHVGHCHPDVVQAEIEQASVVNTNSRFLNDNIVLYAKKLSSLFPAPLSVCFFVNSGSEANDLAIQLARHHTRHKDVIAVEHAYHGNLTTLINVSSYKLKEAEFVKKPKWVHLAPCPDVYRGKYVKTEENTLEELGLLYADEVRQIIENCKSSGRNVAAFIFESLLSCGGQIIPPPNYLSNAFKYVRQAGGVCIVDEVQVGFGRVGKHWWGFQLQGDDIVPDIVTLGKPIGNGYPISAVITTPAIASSFAQNMSNTAMGFFSTFGGNPVACSVALSVLDVIQKENLRSNAINVGSRLLELLNDLKNRHVLIGDVRGIGLFVGIELVRNRILKTPAKDEAKYVIDKMREEKILVSRDGPDKNVLKLKPPMVFNEQNAEEFSRKLDEILSDLESANNYPL